MNTRRLTIIAVILSAFVVERTFAQECETADLLAPTRGPAVEAPARSEGVSHGLVDRVTHGVELANARLARRVPSSATIRTDRR